MKTTTDAKNWRFYFTVTDLARFLGKSPVTVRGWERRGLVSIPRDSGDNRKLTTTDVREITKIAREDKRITGWRYQIVNLAMTALELIERENIR